VGIYCRVAELFLLGPDPMITILSGLELEVEISTFGIGCEEGGMLLRGHIEVLIDLSTLSKFQFQHPLFRSIADASDTAGVYWNSLHAFLDADEPPPEDRENSSHAHKQDIGAATRRSPKGTGLPPS